jgi:superfamily II DNA helicase RecQ
MKSLHIDPRNFVLVNKGNFRPNILLDVGRLSGTKKAIPEILDYIPTLSPATEHIPLTIIFVNSRTDGHSILTYLQEVLPDHYAKQVKLFHALLSNRAKKWTFHQCMTEKSGIYICTEVAAMVSLWYLK